MMETKKIYYEHKDLLKKCTKCNEIKPREDFLWKRRTGQPKHFRYRNSRCILCMRKVYEFHNKTLAGKRSQRNYSCTEKGVFKKLANSMNANAKKRRKTNSHRTRDEVTLGYDDLKQKWEQQNQKCDYSGMTMTYEKGHYNTVSVERLDNNKGYTDENTVLICWAFQTYHGKWSKEKWQQFYHHKPDQGIDEKIIVKNIQLASIRRGKKQPDTPRIHKIENGVVEIQCKKCLQFLPLEEYHVQNRDKMFGKRDECKSCIKIRDKEYRNTLRGFLKNFLPHAKAHCKQITRTNGREFINDLTFEDLLDMYAEQKERCAYSDMPIYFYQTDSWQASLERKDPTIGYTRSNCVFVAQEFNGPCQLSRQLVQSWK